MENCIFCQIVAGQIPAVKLYEDEAVLAFLDIAQVTKGHTLVIPKKHIRNVLTMTNDEGSQFFERIPEISQHLIKATGASGMNLVMNNEAIANQVVFHSHAHLMPRYEDDGLLFESEKHMTSQDDLENLANDLGLKMKSKTHQDKKEIENPLG